MERTSHVLIKLVAPTAGSTRNQRHRLDKVNLSGVVGQLKFLAADLYGLRPDQLDLIYCGRCLQDSKSLEFYSIDTGATILAVKKLVRLDNENPTPVDEQKLQAAFRIFKNRNFESILDRVITDPGTIEKLKTSSKSLASDPVALALLQDCNLLLMCMKDENSRQRAFTEHPGLYDAVIQILGLVSAELNNSSSSRTVGRQQYNLDRMDSEEIESDTEDDQTSSNIANVAGWTMPALAPGSAITADFFRQAIAAVSNAPMDTSPTATARAPASAAAAAQVIQAQLQQLRDMGIADEALARHALQETGGDIQAALAYIFGDDG